MGLPREVISGKRVLEVGPSEDVVLLLTIEVTLDQILGKWYYVIKHIHRIKDLLNVVSYLIVFFLCGCANPCSEECFL
jgi:hypothetical protein